MTTPIELVALVGETAGEGLTEETPQAAIVSALLDDEAVRNKWKALRDAPPDYLLEAVITQAGTDAGLPKDGPPPAGTKFRITLRKKQQTGQLRFLFAPKGDDWHAGLNTADYILIADMAESGTFTTYRGRFQRWTTDPPLAFAPSEELPDPRKFAADFTQKNWIQADLRPWILATAPTDTTDANAVFQEWRRAAAVRLLAALADQLSVDSGLVFHFSGPPAVLVKEVDIDPVALFDRLNADAIWVFAEGTRDADTRHLLLANEWARSHGRGAAGDFGKDALVSAQNAYSAYVKVGSKETLKAIADLRSGVVDESQKISQRAQDLAGALWKDLAVAAAPFVLKILADSARIPNRSVAGGLALAAALFLVYSFGMQVFINRRYFKRQDEARKIWRSALSTVLSPQEIQDYSETPIARSVDDYRTVRFWVGVFYGALVAVLLVFTYSNLAGDGPGEPATNMAEPLNSTRNESANLLKADNVSAPHVPPARQPSQPGRPARN